MTESNVVGQVINVPLKLIWADEEFNCRGNIAPIDVVGLAKDIEANGLIQPVTICELAADDPKRQEGFLYKLIAGYRRFMAHKVIKRDHIDAICKQEMLDERKARLFNLSENLQRQDLSIMQEAKAVKKLHELGMSIDYVSRELSKSFGWVQVRFYLLNLPELIQKEVAQGYIAQLQIRDLYTIYKTHGEDECIKATKFLKEAKEKGEKGVRVKPKNKKEGNAKRIRNRAEILNMLYHIQDTIGNGLHSRCLAWAAGEVSNTELFQDLRTKADETGITYTLPEWIND